MEAERTPLVSTGGFFYSGSLYSFEGMNVRTLYIEHEENGNDDDVYIRPEALSGMVREHSMDLTFIFTLSINGTIQVRRKFWARFKPSDFDDPEYLANRIISQLKHGERPEIWDNAPTIHCNEWADEIRIDPRTKEWFSFLSQYKQKLLEVFA